MMRIRKTLSILLLFSILTGLFAGCGKGTKRTSDGNQYDESFLSQRQELSSVYFSAVDLNTALPSDPAPKVLGGTVSGEMTALLLSSEDAYFIELFDLQGNQEDAFEVSLPEETFMSSILMMQKNSSLYIAVSYPQILHLISIDLPGKKIVSDWEVTPGEKEEFGDLFAIKDDTFYVESKPLEGILCQGYSIKDGSCVIAMGEEAWADGFFFLKNDLHALCGVDGKDRKDVVTIRKDGSLEKTGETDLPEFWQSLLYLEDMQYIRDKDGIWYLNEEERAWKNLVSFQSSDADPIELPYFDHYYVSTMRDRILLYGTDSSKVQLLFPGQDPNIGKKTLTVAGSDLTEDLIWAISEFNRRNKDYKIEFVDYFDMVDMDAYIDEKGALDVEAYIDAVADLLWKQVVRGEGPDILIRSFARDDRNKLSSRYFEYGGLLMDLSSLWEGTDAALKDQILPYFASCMTCGEKMYAIPLKTLVTYTRKGEDGPQGSDATYRDWLDFMETQGAGRALINETGRDFLLHCLDMDLDGLAFGADGQVNFDNEEFRALLTLGREYCLTQKEWETGTERETCLTFGIASAADFYAFLRKDPQTRYEMYGCITSSGIDPCLIPSYSASITTGCSDVEGAWEFICFLLSRDAQEYAMSGPDGFLLYLPVREDSMDAVFDFYLHPQDHREYYESLLEPEEDQTGVSSDLPSMTQDEADKVKKILRSIHHVSYPDKEICGIILEEAEAYLSRSRSMDDVIRQINSRVQNIVNERK
ncbi:MAG: hypothetical protein IKZ90_00775 [Clostridiales bacterium]|nr:hypothetical protein [Clostridiales bacterium]